MNTDHSAVENSLPPTQPIDISQILPSPAAEAEPTPPDRPVGRHPGRAGRRARGS